MLGRQSINLFLFCYLLQVIALVGTARAPPEVVGPYVVECAASLWFAGSNWLAARRLESAHEELLAGWLTWPGM